MSTTRDNAHGLRLTGQVRQDPRQLAVLFRRLADAAINIRQIELLASLSQPDAYWLQIVLDGVQPAIHQSLLAEIQQQLDLNPQAN